ncbi:MAG: glycoside hydrolase family 88 protein [Verrucomicrobiota bacterium]
MRHSTRILTLLNVLVVLTMNVSATSESNRPSAESVKALTNRVADWQIANFDKELEYRALSTHQKKQNEENGWVPWRWPELGWHKGALYVGMYEWSTAGDDPKYADWLMMIGKRNHWKLHKRKYHADDHTVGQFYLNLYEDIGAPEMIEPTRKRFDAILAEPKMGSMKYSGYKNPNTDWLDRWGWCDALFMAPPVWTRLAKITGEQKYLDFMHQEYRATYDLLWDDEEKLFWRDTSFFNKREQNGRKLFWSRGNGWVFAGLALMIPDMPDDWEFRPFYVEVFKQMAASLVSLQRADGTWSMGLLGGEQGYPIKETSGTSFFVYGLAWGVNNGILDRATYEPIILKAWSALEECVTPEGMLGHVQPVGAAPGDSFPDKTEVYGIGAFLAAGSEVYKMLSHN